MANQLAIVMTVTRPRAYLADKNIRMVSEHAAPSTLHGVYYFTDHTAPSTLHTLHGFSLKVTTSQTTLLRLHCIHCMVSH